MHMSQPILYGLISFFGWAVGDIFGTFAARKVGSYSALLWNLVFGIVSISIFIPFVLSDLANLDLRVLFLNIILGVVFIIGYLAFNEGLRTTNPSLVGSISASFAAVTVIFSIIFFKEKITTSQTISIVIIFLGIFFSGLDFKKLRRKNITRTGIFLGLITMILWGIYYTFIRIPISKIGWFWPQYI